MKLTLFLLILGLARSGLFADEPAIDRRVLPPPTPEFKGRIGDTYEDSTPDFSPALPLTAPKGAPNVLIVLLDDVGFGQLGCYGGPIDTPNIDRLASKGLRYNNFHTTALCSPSRAALLTGRNHQAVSMAAITEAATGFPGNYGSIPKSAATIAETLKLNGFNTMAFGKWHLTPYTAYTVAGPYDHWPLGMGFERYYGFLGGETDQWAPLLIQDNTMIETPTRPGYHLTTDLIDHTIRYIRDLQQTSTGRPFFTYLALGACHAPLHAPKENIARYKGKFNQGWDKVREETFERQQKLGIMPSNAKLPAPNPGVKPWADLNADQRIVYTRLQEVFAGFLDHTDQELGRLFAALDEMGITDNTLIILTSDNGASQEGLRDGTLNTDRFRNYFPDTVEEMIEHLDAAGGPSTDPHYPMGWSMAGNAPFKRWKQDTHAGGNTDAFILSWPAKIKEHGGIRNQYHHIVDVVPTILELTGLPAPTTVNGTKQQSLPGVSMAYTFTDSEAKTRKKSQYYEMLGSRAIWADGWKAVVWHKKDTPYTEDKWELYNTDVDPTEFQDLAAENPGKLQQLQDLWRTEAEVNNVFPLDDRRYERVADPTRPVAALPRDEYTYYAGTSIVHPLAAPQLPGVEHTITAYLTIPDTGAEGVLACTGGEFGGWSLFLKDGRFHYVHNFLKLDEADVVSPDVIPAGKHTLSAHFTPTMKNLKPDYFLGDLALYVDGMQVAQQKDIKVAGQYSAVTGYGLLFGRNTGTSVSRQYKPPFTFSGQLEKVIIRVGSKGQIP